MILYRPVGPEELKLIELSGWSRFPDRLSHQPFFYPVMNKEYANEISEKWNLPAYGSGFVTMFDVDDVYINKYEVHNVGCDIHNELWIPSDELDEFNKNIIGLIKVINSFK